jgi:hypothetical protein
LDPMPEQNPYEAPEPDERPNPELWQRPVAKLIGWSIILGVIAAPAIYMLRAFIWYASR